MKKIFILIVCVLLYGCAPYLGVISREQVLKYPPDLMLMKEDFIKSKKAMVVYQQDVGIYENSIWKNTSFYSNKDIYLKEGSNKKERDGYQILIITPGIYSFSSLYKKSGGEVRKIELLENLYDYENKKPKVASFEAKAGEVVYIGDFNIDYTIKSSELFSKRVSVIFKIKLNDNFDKAKEFFNKEYPELDGLMIKRLLIINEANGK